MIRNDILTLAGLAPHEAAIYASLLEGGPATVAVIAKRSGLHRPVIYKALPRLRTLGLVSPSAKGSRTQFVAAPPSRLEKLFDERAKHFRAELLALESMRVNDDAKAGVRILEGATGLAAVLDDMVKTLGKGGTFYRITSRKKDTSAEKFVPPGYRASRDAKKIQQYVITNVALRGSTYRKRMDCLSKAVPEGGEPFEYDIATVIYADRVAIVDYAAEQAVIIQNPRLAAFQTRLFRMLFDRI